MAGALLLLAGCAGIPADALRLGPDSMANRAMQTRSFPAASLRVTVQRVVYTNERFAEVKSADREKTLRAIIATMQDLSFVLEKADASSGASAARSSPATNCG